MGEEKLNFELSGWKAVVILIVLIAAVGIRIVSMGDKKGDANLMEKIRFQLMTEYFPSDVDKLKAAVESGDNDRITAVSQSVLSTRLDIKSVKVSYSIFNFSSKKKNVVVKVDYSVDDQFGTRKKGTQYYLFEHSPMFNRWEYRSKSLAFRYWSNFI